MINRELIDATVKTYGGIDDYGQPLAELTSSRNIQMVFGVYSQENINNPNYVNVTHYGLTKDRDITDADYISIGGKDYKVKQVNNTTRWTQLLLCE